MPWWAIIYTAVFAVIGAAAFDRGSEMWEAVAEIFSTGFGVAFLAGYFDPEVALRMGMMVVPAFAAKLTFDAYSAVKDLRTVAADPELSTMENTLIRVAAVIFLLPPLAAGGVLSVRHLGWL